MISMMRVYGLYAGTTSGKDVKKGNLDFQNVTVMFEGGKKNQFKAFGRLTGFENINFGDKITFDVDTPSLVMASYGDCMWQCAEMRLVQDKPTHQHKAA